MLGMLNSCGSGVAVVNIDNRFGAAYHRHNQSLDRLMRCSALRVIFADANSRRLDSTLQSRGDRSVFALVLVPRRRLRSASLALDVLVAALGRAALRGFVRPGHDA